MYVGHDLLLDCSVAIKALRPELAMDRTARERFGKQATAAAGLTHPNIVGILDLGDDHGTPFIIMEYVPSETLRDVIVAEGPFGPDDVASLLEQVSAALDFAHERGISHRSVTPRNILVESSGVAKLINFGSATGPNPAISAERGDSLESALYLSPEQSNGLIATPSSDIYALGVVAFEMLTGTPPFHADNFAAVAMHHVHVAPAPPSTRFAGIPPIVDAIVLRAMEKDPSRRFPTAGSFARAMLSWNAQATSGHPTLGRSPEASAEIGDTGEADDDELRRPNGRGLRARMSRLVGLGLATAAVGTISSLL